MELENVEFEIQKINPQIKVEETDQNYFKITYGKKVPALICLLKNENKEWIVRYSGEFENDLNTYTFDSFRDAVKDIERFFDNVKASVDSVQEPITYDEWRKKAFADDTKEKQDKNRITPYVHLEGKSKALDDKELTIPIHKWDADKYSVSFIQNVADELTKFVDEHTPDGIELDYSKPKANLDEIERERHKPELEFLNRQVKAINPDFHVEYLSNISYDLKYKDNWVLHFQEQTDYWFVMFGDSVPGTDFAFKSLQSVLHFIRDLNWTVSQFKQE